MMNSLKSPAHPLDSLFSETSQVPDGPFSGLYGALDSLLLAFLARKPRLTILLVNNSDRAQELFAETRCWLGNRRHRVSMFLPERQSIYDQTAIDPAIRNSRLASLGMNSGGGVIICALPAACERFGNASSWRNSCLTLQPDVPEKSGPPGTHTPSVAGTPSKNVPSVELSGYWPSVAGISISREDLLKRLVAMGYIRAALVETPGTFAVRGSLLDIFPPNLELPVRLDFFGDELETLKSFSAETQRTLEKIKEVRLIPVFERLTTPEQLKNLTTCLEKAASNLDPTRQEILHRRLEHLKANPDSTDVRELQPFSAPDTGFFWDFFENPGILLENPDQIPETLEDIHQQQETAFLKNRDLTPLLPPQGYFHSPENILQSLREKGARGFSRFRQTPPGKGEVGRRHQNSVLQSPSPSQGIAPKHMRHPWLFGGIHPIVGIDFDVETLPVPTDTSKDSLLKDLRRWIDERFAITLIIEDEHRFHNLKGLLGERHFPIKSSPDPMGMTYGAISMLNGTCDRGFLSRTHKIVVLGEQDLYLQARHEPRAVKSRATSAWTISQLVPGDLVVHSDHGVAQYGGIHKMKAGGNEREYLLLQYAGSDKLYVPTDQVHKVQKYLGMEGVRPSIHSLNSKVWDSQKRRVSKNVESIARELLELYAKREASKGFAFLPDGDMQFEMEKRFPFIETPDQAKAIEAVKSDMESETPMDRIVCGDVGYGKTEVALRSAFKAICSGKQVAVLTPTTLLAFQHFQTFSLRFQDLAVKVSMVSRLVNAREQKSIIEKTGKGQTDVLIGTHRILSSDVKFKDLGLLIIDEEQRFGVKHKEKFKHLRESLDVLTLTATPIPRTLHMALSGVRQISVIDTPPENRRPINTYVAPFDTGWTKRAIIEELRRGGQVYYVFNRVEKIDLKAAFLRDLVPEARIVIAHGQMDEKIVEKTMLAFIQKKFDVLLTTTIIESGLDIPNVNTLIVDEAERLGLAQMYQLRGRVGRSARQAYAYFFYSKGKRLTQEASDRLATIEEHTALGSGFKIAMRDLQIRGAGNILGKEQSGNIASVGFSLYIELLEEAVAKLRGHALPRPPETAIEIPVTALFPPYYISEDETRIDMYARLGRCNDLELLKILRGECEDRFGDLPEEGRRLFQVARLRILAGGSGVKKITQQIHRLRFEFDPDHTPDPTRIIDTRTMFFKRLTMNPNDPNSIQLSIEGISGDAILQFAEKFLISVSPSVEAVSTADA